MDNIQTSLKRCACMHESQKKAQTLDDYSHREKLVLPPRRVFPIGFDILVHLARWHQDSHAYSSSVQTFLRLAYPLIRCIHAVLSSPFGLTLQFDLFFLTCERALTFLVEGTWGMEIQRDEDKPTDSSCGSTRSFILSSIFWSCSAYSHASLVK